MTAEDTQGARLELAILEMRGSVDVRLTEISGHLLLLAQRMDSAEQRSNDRDRAAREARDEQARLIQRLDERVDTIEANAVTRTDLAQRSGRTVAILGLIVTVVSVLTSTGTAVIVAIVN